jgi:hypothetical protein
VLFGIIDVGVALVLVAAVLAAVALGLDLADHSSPPAARPWWHRWLASGRL